MDFMDQLITNYGYAAIFILLALGLFSIPIPDEVMILFVGYFTKEGYLHYSFSLIAIFTGSLLGMFISYMLGHKLGRPFLNWLGKWSKFSGSMFKKAEEWVTKYGATAIIISYFIPGMRHIAGYFCGISHMPLKTYMLFASASALLWGFIFLTIGRIF